MSTQIYKTPFNKITKYLCDSLKVNENTPFEVLEIDAHELITPSRLDLIAKIIYIESREKNSNVECARDLYARHIVAFSDGIVKEEGNHEKDSLEKYVEMFDMLIDDIKENGFNENISLIPIGQNNALFDGAHRSACSIYFNKRVKVLKFLDKTPRRFDFHFFRSRFLEDKYIEVMVEKFCELTNNTHIVFVWPTIKNTDEKKICRLMDEYQCEIVYEKHYKFSYDEFWQLIYEIYQNEPWVGSASNNFKGIDQKATNCFHKSGRVGLYVVTNPSLEAITAMKQEVREIYKMGNHCMHTTDTKDEALSILNFLFHLDDAVKKDKKDKKDSYYRIGRKARYCYTRCLNIIKKILGRPL